MTLGFGSADLKSLRDTDVGADDAIAIILALQNYRALGIEIVAFTTVHGNVPVEQGWGAAQLLPVSQSK